MADPAHDNHIDVVGIGVMAKNLGRVAHDHVLLLRRNTVALGQFAEGIGLCVEQCLGFAWREKRRGVVEIELVRADR